MFIKNDPIRYKLMPYKLVKFRNTSPFPLKFPHPALVPQEKKFRQSLVEGFLVSAHLLLAGLLEDICLTPRSLLSLSLKFNNAICHLFAESPLFIYFLNHVN